MNKKKWIGFFVVLGYVAVAPAMVLVDYSFNDPTGTGLSNILNAGVDSGAFAADQVGVATDGNGVLHIVATNANAHSTHTLDSTLYSGMVTSSWTVAAFDLSGNTVGLTDAFFGVELGDGSTLRLGLRYNNSGEVAIRQAMPAYNRDEPIAGGITATNAALNLRIVIDLDANQIYSEWQWDGSASWTQVANAVTKDYLTTGVAGLVIDIENSDWGSSDFIDVDTYSLRDSGQAPDLSPPDAPITPAQFANVLGRGFLLEPETPPISGLPGRGHALGALYTSEHGQMIKDLGFDHVRVRYQSGNDVVGEALTAGPPYDSRVLDDMERIIDDLISKDLVPVLTFYGLTHDDPGEFEKMTNWWSFVAERFQEKSHTLMFNYFVEPRLGRDSVRYSEYLEAISLEIRKTNPTRMCGCMVSSGSDDIPKFPYSLDGNGADVLTAVAPPPSAGKYWFWDTHLLKSDVATNIRKVIQGAEYADATKVPVWSGAWSTRSDFLNLNESPRAYGDGLLQLTMQQSGFPGAFLMLYDGGTRIYDGDDDEWIHPYVRDAISTGFASLWMNLLGNAGFEYGSSNWVFSGGSVVLSEGSGQDFGSALFLAASSGYTIKQDITTACRNLRCFGQRQKRWKLRGNVPDSRCG